VSINELYEAVEKFLYSQPKADGVSLSIRLDATRRDKNRIEAAVTLLTQDGKQDAKTHARALFGDASAPTVHFYLLRLVEMTFEAAQLQDQNPDEEEEPEEPEDDEVRWDEYDRMNLISLKEELRQRDLSTNGNKIQLIRRLRSDDERSASAR